MHFGVLKEVIKNQGMCTPMKTASMMNNDMKIKQIKISKWVCAHP